MTKKIVGIWAQDEQGVIGKDQVLPWSLPAELQHFKQTTIGHNLLMGRVTFDGMGQRALPKRLSLILTRDRDYQVDNERVLVFHSVEEILDWYEKQDKNLYVIEASKSSASLSPIWMRLSRPISMPAMREIPISQRILTGLSGLKSHPIFVPKMQTIQLISPFGSIQRK